MRSTIGLLLAGLVAAASSSLAAQGLDQGRSWQSPVGHGLALIETAQGYLVEDSEGSARAVDFPAGTIPSAFHEVAEGWIAAGHRWIDSGSDIVLVREREGELELLEAPFKSQIGFRIVPVLLVEKGRLWGLAWLEGDSGEKNAVMAARWNGDGWEPVETVSPVTGEAQLALSGTVLGDGSALLAWAAVDGADDEVLWSRSEPRGWSAPERAHPDNDVPDIVPRAAAIEGGALLAWSQYDGKDYRLRVARFDGRDWADTGFVGEEGSFYPTLFPAPAGAGFLYQTASPRSWAVIDFDAAGKLSRRAVMPRVAAEARPMIWLGQSREVRFPSAAEMAPAAATEPRGLVWGDQR